MCKLTHNLPVEDCAQDISGWDLWLVFSKLNASHEASTWLFATSSVLPYLHEKHSEHHLKLLNAITRQLQLYLGQHTYISCKEHRTCGKESNGLENRLAQQMNYLFG